MHQDTRTPLRHPSHARYRTGRNGEGACHAAQTKRIACCKSHVARFIIVSLVTAQPKHDCNSGTHVRSSAQQLGAIELWLHAVWVMPCGSCRVGHAVWVMPCGSCRVGHAVWVMPCGSCCVGHAVWVMPCGSCRVGHAVWVVANATASAVPDGAAGANAAPARTALLAFAEARVDTCSDFAWTDLVRFEILRTRTHAHAYMHMHTRACLHAGTHIHTHARARAHTHTHTHTHTRARAHTHVLHAHARTHAKTRTYAYIQRRTQTLTRTHTRTLHATRAHTETSSDLA